MVKPVWPAFTLNFICHDDAEIFRETLPHNIAQICGGLRRDVDIVVTIDGAENSRLPEMLEIARTNQVNEIRLHFRGHNCAAGDGSSNGHLHAFNDKTRFLITIDSDVAFFRTDPDFGPLDAFAASLNAIPTDHSCTGWIITPAGSGSWSLPRRILNRGCNRLTGWRRIFWFMMWLRRGGSLAHPILMGCMTVTTLGLISKIACPTNSQSHRGRVSLSRPPGRCGCFTAPQDHNGFSALLRIKLEVFHQRKDEVAALMAPHTDPVS